MSSFPNPPDMCMMYCCGCCARCETIFLSNLAVQLCVPRNTSCYSFQETGSVTHFVADVPAVVRVIAV